MTDQEVQDFLYEAISEQLDKLSDELGLHVSLSTYEENGVLTYNKGVVLTAGTHQFQISIVRSR